MPRINIEDKLFKDTRWWNFVIKVGCQYKALGMVTKAWILAQEHWINYGCIPIKAWINDLDALIDVELAERMPSGDIYVKGSKKAFSWLEQRVEAGRKGGLKKRTQNQRNNDQENIQKNGARFILNKAVNSGKIQKPTLCEACGIGGVVIEGHHSDYLKPLDVAWLCKNCHTEIHRALRLESAKRPLDLDSHSLEPAKAPSLTPTLITTTSPNKVDAIGSVKTFMTWWNKAAEEIDIIKVYESPDNVALIARHIAENPDMEFWKKAINAISLDSFYQGSNKNKAKMNIGWFFKNRTVANLMDVHETKKDLFKGVLDD